MRRLFFDQFEFDSFSSEESLEIHVAHKVVTGIVQFESVNSFAAATNGPGAMDPHSEASHYADRAGCSSVRQYLRRFAGVNVPDPCNWKMWVLFEDDLEWDGIFKSPEMFIRYHWLSTA